MPTRVIVELECQQQDFTAFHLVNGEIVETLPCQGWLWNGRKVLNPSVGVGDRLVLTSHDDQKELILKYPVAAVRVVFDEVTP